MPAPAVLQDGGSHWFQHLCELCSAALPSKRAVREPWHSGYIGSSGIASFQLIPLMGWGCHPLLQMAPIGAPHWHEPLSTWPGTSHTRMASSSATPQMANVSPRGPDPPKHCTHQGGLGLQNPFSRMIQVQDISLNCVLEKNVVIWATKE